MDIDHTQADEASGKAGRHQLPPDAINRTRAREAFAAYVAPYDPSNPRISLKIAHTYRVAELCDRIARSLALSPADVDLAWLCGLLHDVGRFEQVRRWDTFRDAESTSHALLGADVLFGTREHLGTPVASTDGTPLPPRIRDYLDSPASDELIRTVIATHSDFALPKDLNPRTRLFCDITRDADKIDIVRTVDTDTPETILGCSADTLLDSGLSATATRAFDEHHCMLRSDRSEPADFLVNFACFAFELVHPESRRLMREQGYLHGLLTHPFGIEQPFRNPHTRAEFERMASELESWLGADASTPTTQSKETATHA